MFFIKESPCAQVVGGDRKCHTVVGTSHVQRAFEVSEEIRHRWENLRVMLCPFSGSHAGQRERSCICLDTVASGLPHKGQNFTQVRIEFTMYIVHIICYVLYILTVTSILKSHFWKQKLCILFLTFRFLLKDKRNIGDMLMSSACPSSPSTLSDVRCKAGLV